MEKMDRFDITILYAEDDATTREEIEQFLRHRVERVLVAEDGKAGLELFRQHAPDLIITDIRMPVMDGLQMVHAIHELSPEVRVIATTAHSESAYLMLAIEAGIDHYVLKPIDMKKLHSIIGKCCRDIIAQKAILRHNEEREKLIGELQTALTEIKILQGFLPICSFCKKIRNDEGYWEQLEEYITNHSQAVFSHSICSDCMEKHYPEVHIAIKNKQEGNVA
ncbi:MAG: response regulator [Desulfurivibrionaceae bacterium]